MESSPSTKLQHSLLRVRISSDELIKRIWFIGLITYGGPLSHIGIFKRMFVDQLQWVTNDIFVQLTTICQSIPGPTSTQLLISICMLSTESIQGGLIAYLAFSIPTFVLLMIAGYVFKDSIEINPLIYFMLKGFMCVAVGLVAQAFWGLSTKFRSNYKSKVVFIACALIYILHPTIYCMILLFISSALYSLYFKQVQSSFQKHNQQVQNILNHPILGKKSFFILIILFGASFLLPILINTKITNQISIFYRMGSMIIGGGHVILPIMWSQLEPYNYMTQTQFWTGFSIVSCLPGPMFNLTSYIGSLINGFVGSFVCTISLNLPALLSLFAVMPYWQYYRSKQKVQKVIDGLCCAALGLILAAVFMLWKSACYNQISSQPFMVIYNTLIVGVGFYCLQIGKLSIPVTMLIGGILELIAGIILFKTQPLD